jgi:hypothetical protein
VNRWNTSANALPIRNTDTTLQNKEISSCGSSNLNMANQLQSPPKRQRTGEGFQQDISLLGVQCTAAEFRAQAVSFLVSRHVDIRGPQAASLKLRPSLQKVHDDLMLVLNSAVQLKQNASLLVVGEPGIGKTLVSGSAGVANGEQHMDVYQLQA